MNFIPSRLPALLLLPVLGCSLHLKGTYDLPDAEIGPDLIDQVELDADADMEVGMDIDAREDTGSPERPDFADMPEDPPPPDEIEEAEIVPDAEDGDPREEELTCAADCSGHGDCIGGECICHAGYAPPACDVCSDGYTGYPDCVHCGNLDEPCCDGGICPGGLECVSGTCSEACPPDMARIGETNVCIDLYEASRDGGTARSQAGVNPWADLTRNEAAGGCTNAGKRLCTSSEWRSACGGPGALSFPYGAAFQAGWCNDTNSGSCPRDGSGVLPTGSLSTCAGGYTGIFDMSGNVWEWVSDTGSGQCGLMGGSVDSCADADLLNCNDLEWQTCGLRWPGLGFRCCLTLD